MAIKLNPVKSKEKNYVEDIEIQQSTSVETIRFDQVSDMSDEDAIEEGILGLEAIVIKHGKVYARYRKGVQYDYEECVNVLFE